MDLLNKLNPFKSESASKDASANDLRNITRFFYIFALLSVAAVIAHCGFSKAAATPLLWALACASVGAGVGFLFGIPKILQGGAPKADDKDQRRIDYRQQVNTNLTEISDWLTKIIVGLGLINLGSIPGRLGNAALSLSTGLDPVDPNKNKAFALALIVCYLILGFLFGYLSTRLFLQAAFSRADLAASSEAQSAIDSKLQALETKQEFLLSSLPTKQERAAAPGVSFSLNARPAAEPSGDGGATGTIAPAKLKAAMNTLRQAADNYLAITAPTLAERVRLKNEAAKGMLSIILGNGITKEAILSDLEKENHEGLILALANYILTFPEQGDLRMVVRVADATSRMHVKYRIVQAIGDLFDRNCATEADVPEVRRILDTYEKGSDESLRFLIQGTRARIERLVNREQVAR